MNKLFGRKSEKNDPSKDSESAQEHLLTREDIQKYELYKKGVNHMADEKFREAIRDFDLATKIDPHFVDAWLKKGYAYFHMNEYPISISCYDHALDIDVDNPEVWNLKGLSYYKMQNMDKAIESCEKSLDLDPNNGMTWYNYACYLVLSGKTEEGIEALKRSIEIDISNAKKAVRDRDFENARGIEGFQRIIEVVVLEAVRQGYDYVGKIVWITGMDSIDVENALTNLEIKGLLSKKVERKFFNKEEYYELSKEIASKVGTLKRSGFLKGEKELTPPIQQLKDLSELLGSIKDSVESGNVSKTLDQFEKLINPSVHGSIMIERFFNEHRDLRLFYNRLQDKGQEYLITHKKDFLNLIESIDAKIRSNTISN